MKRSFASLTPQEALQIAIFIEERNAAIYSDFAKMFAEFGDPQSTETAAAFSEMSREERRHGAILQERYVQMYGGSRCAISEEEISDLIEVPRLDVGDFFADNRFEEGPSPREKALEVAAAAEESALRFYRRLAESSQDQELRTLYQEFANFEANHTGWLDEQLSQLRRAIGSECLKDN